MGHIAFTGPRDLPTVAWMPTVSLMVERILRAGHHIGVGDATGLDVMVRSSCRVLGHEFKAFDAPVRTPPNLVARSMRMVNWAVPRGVLLGYVNRPCPSTIKPEKGWTSGSSGTWSTIAYAVGMGIHVYVRRCGVKASEMPRWDGGVWSLPAVKGAEWDMWLVWTPKVDAFEEPVVTEPEVKIEAIRQAVQRTTEMLIQAREHLETLPVPVHVKPFPAAYAVMGYGARVPWWAGWFAAWRHLWLKLTASAWRFATGGLV